MKKIFIDLGAHCGCSRRMFQAKHDLANEFEIYSFEPNMLLHKYCDKLIQKAAWIYDGEIILHQFGEGGGSTISKNKSDYQQKNKPNVITTQQYKQITVPCFDVDKFIQQFNQNDYIILKMDIEGAEYEILKHIIELGSIKFINELFIEWHDWRCNISKEINSQLETSIKKYNININNRWNAMEQQWCRKIFKS